ncbi:hypothetical protein B0H11DRAFT_2221024 [Mycena galericulata]|nr:hypothetical protein B0H11DRAFT_2221024 [Mycena galericulata]
MPPAERLITIVCFHLHSALNSLLLRPILYFSTGFTMSTALPAGTRVFYFNGAGQTVYGTVQRTMNTDGNSLVEVKVDTTGTMIILP